MTGPQNLDWKGFSPEGALDNIDLSVPSEERTRALRQEMNYMVAGLAHGAARGRPGGQRRCTCAVMGWEQGGGKVEDEDSGKTINKEKFRVLFCKLNFSPYS